MKPISASKSPLYASLISKPVTDEARAFVSALSGGLEFHEKNTGKRVYARRGDMLQQFEFAVGAFLADLLRAAGHAEAAGWVFRSMKAESFTGEQVSHRTFKALVTSLIQLRYVDTVPGYQRWARLVPGFDQADNGHQRRPPLLQPKPVDP